MLEAADQFDSMEGCALYIINMSENDPDVVWITELWRDAEAHAASLQNENVLALIQKCMPLMVAAEPIKLRPVGSKGLCPPCRVRIDFGHVFFLPIGRAWAYSI